MFTITSIFSIYKLEAVEFFTLCLLIQQAKTHKQIICARVEAPAQALTTA